MQIKDKIEFSTYIVPLTELLKLMDYNKIYHRNIVYLFLWIEILFGKN